MSAHTKGGCGKRTDLPRKGSRFSSKLDELSRYEKMVRVYVPAGGRPRLRAGSCVDIPTPSWDTPPHTCTAHRDQSRQPTDDTAQQSIRNEQNQPRMEISTLLLNRTPENELQDKRRTGWCPPHAAAASHDRTCTCRSMHTCMLGGAKTSRDGATKVG